MFATLRKVVRSETLWINVIGFAVAGASGASVALCVRGVGDAGDALVFVGALAGTGLAVRGTLWIDERKERLKEKRQKDLMRDALKALIRASDYMFAAQDPERAGKKIEEVQSSIKLALWEYGNARDGFAFAKDQFNTENLELFLALRKLEYRIDEFEDRYRTERAFFENRNVTEAVVENFRDNTVAFADTLFGTSNHISQMLDR
jgi:hypothetical protein